MLFQHIDRLHQLLLCLMSGCVESSYMRHEGRANVYIRNLIIAKVRDWLIYLFNYSFISFCSTGNWN